MDYQEAMSYLQNLTKFGFNFGLGRITELLSRLGNPHHSLKIIHVGGTNGKGSTVAMIAQILRSAGMRVGTFTSPHLHSYTERYLLNGTPIGEEQVAEIITSLRPHIDAMVREGFEHPTEFEVGTALAFCYFAREKVDFLVLEVGLGGAIDSTNVVVPLVSVITNVAMDHMDYLGQTIQEIARVKAGIIKERVPLITAATGKALTVITEACQEKGAPYILVGKDITWELLSHDLSGQSFNIYSRRKNYKDLFIQLLGAHQLENAAIAVAVVEVLKELGYTLSEKSVRLGLANTHWPARFEIILEEPVVIVDGAHNHEGARALRRALADYFPAKPLVLVLGMLGDKERSKIVAELAPLSRVLIFTRPNSPRSGNWKQLAFEARGLVNEVYLIEDIEAATKEALKIASRGEVVCITGSLYMVADAREVLLRLKKDLVFPWGKRREGVGNLEILK